MLNQQSRISFTVFVFLLLAFTTSACSSTSSIITDYSRVRSYQSISDLAEDSELIAVGTVTNRWTAADIDDTKFTLSRFEITEVLKGDSTVGETVTIRQYGDPGRWEPVLLLQQGKDYLVYLTASGLDGELASQFYITGGNAGLYGLVNQPRAHNELETPELSFTQLEPDASDNLPLFLTPYEALG